MLGGFDEILEFFNIVFQAPNAIMGFQEGSVVLTHSISEQLLDVCLDRGDVIDVSLNFLGSMSREELLSLEERIIVFIRVEENVILQRVCQVLVLLGGSIGAELGGEGLLLRLVLKQPEAFLESFIQSSGDVTHGPRLVDAQATSDMISSSCDGISLAG